MAMAAIDVENEVDQNCLSLFTPNHTNHDTSWMARGSAFKIICVACLIEMLEDKEVLAIRKRKILTELLVLLCRDDKLVEVLSTNMRVSSHLCVILGDLLEASNEAVSEMAIEGVIQLACKLRNELIVREIVNNIESKILGLNNLKKSCPYIVLFGKLVHMITLLGEELVVQKSKLLNYLISNLSFPEETIRISLLYLMLGVCQNKSAKSNLSTESKTVIFKNCCESLMDGKTKVISMNSLALLLSFTCPEDVEELRLLDGEKEGKDKRAFLGSALKKVILNTDESIQIGGIQCMTKFLNLDGSEESILSKALLQCGLAEFVFEGLETNNDIVLASLFCCLTEFCNSTEFFKGSYSIYGIDSVVAAMYKALKLQNPETIQQGLHVLSIIITKQPRGVLLFSNGTIFERCLNAIEECFKSMEYKVIQEAINVVLSLLRIDQMPSGFSIERMLPLLSAVISLLKTFTTKNVENFSGMKAATAQELLCSLLAVINQSISFVNEYQNKSPSLEEALLEDSLSNLKPTIRERSILEVNEFLMRAIDESCIMAVMINYEAISNPSVFETLLSLLTSQLSPANDHHAKLFARKLATASFIRISMDINRRFCKGGSHKSLMQALQQFQRRLILCLTDASEEKQVVGILESTVIPGSPDECLSLLTQSSMDPISSCVSDKMLFKIQCFCIELLYFAYIYQDVIISEQLLLKGLHQFICLHRNLGLLPLVTLRHLVFMYANITVKLKAVLLPRDFQNLIESQNILEAAFIKLPAEEFYKASSNDANFVLWIFGSDKLGKTFGRCLLEKMLSDEKDQFPKMPWSVLKDSEVAVRSLLSLALSENTEVVRKALDIIEKALQHANQQEDPRIIPQITTDELQKLFLRNQVTPLPEHVVMSMLRILLSLQAAIGPEIEVKLLYFVIDILTKPTNRIPSTTVAAINYLNVALSVNMDSPQPRVAAVLFSNRDFISWIQKAMILLGAEDLGKCDDETVSVFAACLLLVSNLVHSQSKLEIVYTIHLTLGKDVLIELLNGNQSCLLRLACLVFWKTFLTSKGKSFVVFEENNVCLESGNEDEILTEMDLGVILVYLQNCLMHESVAIKNCSVNCLKAVMSYTDSEDIYASNQWDIVILESLLFATGKEKLTSNLIQLCTVMLNANGYNKEMGEALSSAVKTIQQQIPNIPVDLDDTGELPIIALSCVEFLRDVVVNPPAFPPFAIDEVLKWCKSLQEISKNMKKTKKQEFVNVGQVIFTKDSLTEQVNRDTRFISEVILRLESNKPQK